MCCFAGFWEVMKQVYLLRFYGEAVDVEHAYEVVGDGEVGIVAAAEVIDEGVVVAVLAHVALDSRARGVCGSTCIEVETGVVLTSAGNVGLHRDGLDGGERSHICDEALLALVAGVSLHLDAAAIAFSSNADFTTCKSNRSDFS